MPTTNDIYTLEERELRHIAKLWSGLAAHPEEATWEATSYVDPDNRYALEGVELNVTDLFKLLNDVEMNNKRAAAKAEEQRIRAIRLKRHVDLLQETNDNLAKRIDDIAIGLYSDKSYSVSKIDWSDPKPLLSIKTRQFKYTARFLHDYMNLLYDFAVKNACCLNDNDITKDKYNYISTLLNLQWKGDTKAIVYNMIDKYDEAKDILQEFKVGCRFTTKIIVNDIDIVTKLVTMYNNTFNEMQEQQQQEPQQQGQEEATPGGQP